jgi:hypothetical protein
MPNKIITRTIVEPTAPKGNPGEAFLVQFRSDGTMAVTYSYDGFEETLDVPSGSQSETRLLLLLSTIRARVWA